MSEQIVSEMQNLLRQRNEEEKCRREEKARSDERLTQQKKINEDKERQDRDTAQTTEIYERIKKALEDSKSGGIQMIEIKSEWSDAALAPFFADDSIFVYVNFVAYCRRCRHQHFAIRHLSSRDCGLCRKCGSCNPFDDCCERPQHV